MSPVFHHVEDEEDANHHEMVLIESGQKSCKFETLFLLSQSWFIKHFHVNTN